MRIEYFDHTEQIVVASFITERRKHNRCIDAALLMVPVRAWSTGFLLGKLLSPAKQRTYCGHTKSFAGRANSDGRAQPDSRYR
ncbi:hypothetical protein [Photorhabdus hindustanensis]|uniref:hypothetical protein n=1 Tax=Photorhabdus hindustanensis TaxID=2918802 RepID=UPI002000C3BA|nr:hypothetical protein [Photorhabdus hindustanensis]